MDDVSVAIIAVVLFVVFIITLIITAVIYFSASSRYRRALARVEKVLGVILGTGTESKAAQAA